MGTGNNGFIGGDPCERVFFARRGGQEQGWKSFISGQKKGALPKLPPNERIVVYFSSSDDEYKAVGDIVKWERWPDQPTALNDLINICESLDDVQLVVRIHPHIAEKSPEDQLFWDSLQHDTGTIFIRAEDAVDTYALIERADLTVTCGSTVGIESVFWGTPSVCLGPSLYSRLGAVYLPTDRDALRKLLICDLLTVENKKALPYGYYFSTFGEKFKYYEPQTLNSGRFCGVNVHMARGACRSLRRASSIIKALKHAIRRCSHRFKG